MDNAFVQPQQQLPYGAPQQGFAPQQGYAPQQGFAPQQGLSPQQGPAPQQGFAPKQGYAAPRGNPTPWMAMPTGIGDCPPGLEYLTQIDQVLVHQQVELLEAFVGIHAKNRYAIKNTLGQQCYFAHEESELCMRICCEAERGFTMHVLDNAGNEVIRVSRPFKYCGGCCWCANSDCCAHQVDIEAPVGNVIGQIRQSQSFWVPYYDIFDHTGKQIFKIKGPCCVCPGPCCTCDFPFDIYTMGDSEAPIGKISKEYGGLVKEMFTNATNFSVSFPMDLDVKMKAVLLGATFLIDMMFFEDNDGDDDC